MSAGTLVSSELQHKSKIVKATAVLAGIKYDVDAQYKHFETNKTPGYLSKFSFGKIPAWDGKDGFKLFEAVAIARYFASLAPNSGLLGQSREDAALIDQWVHLVECELDDYSTLIRQLVTGSLPYTKPIHTTFVERQLRALKTLELHISSRTFFVGERITLADIYVAGCIYRACSLTFDVPVRAAHPNIIRHMETIVNQPALKAIFGPVTYVEKAVQFTPPPKEKKEKKEKEPKPAAAAPKPKKKEVKEEKDEEEEEPLVPAETKAKNPLDDLPKSTFNLEDWKRTYSNKETRGPGGAIEWFYENFDKDGFSIWRVDFKYNEELTLTFMSSNQISGFFNRLDASRKYLFGSVGVLGKANDSAISGVVVLRGKEFEPVMSVAPDWESYSFTPIDLESPESKKFFEGALAWDLELDGKAWADGKNFK